MGGSKYRKYFFLKTDIEKTGQVRAKFTHGVFRIQGVDNHANNIINAKDCEDEYM